MKVVFKRFKAFKTFKPFNLVYMGFIPNRMWGILPRKISRYALEMTGSANTQKLKWRLIQP